jgi:hypothetical protein
MIANRRLRNMGLILQNAGMLQGNAIASVLGWQKKKNK